VSKWKIADAVGIAFCALLIIALGCGAVAIFSHLGRILGAALALAVLAGGYVVRNHEELTFAEAWAWALTGWQELPALFRGAGPKDRPAGEQ
jgi:hypothetical protein